LLRLRSDQQLVTLFREGNEDAFRVIHDRYRVRLLAYVRQMLPGRAGDAEDALQDVFLRTYAGLRTSDRELALRPWLYRVAHNRCIDELRRPVPVPEQLETHDQACDCDPVAETEQRETLRRLVIDIDRLPDQQRSALLMRELSGMAYVDVAHALGISVPAVKSLLVRARIGLAQAVEARDAACVEIRHQLAEAYDQGVRPSWMARRHLRDCAGCRASRAEMRATKRQVAALVPTLGPFAVLGQLFGAGSGGGSATAAGAGAGAGGAAAGSALTAGSATSLAGVTVGHIATVLAAAVVTAGGAVAVQQTVGTHASHAVRAAARHSSRAASAAPAAAPLRMPAKATAPAPPDGGSQASHHQGAGASVTAGMSAYLGAEARSARRHIPPLPAATPTDMAAASGTVAGESTTCTPPPPPTACTASQTSTCSASSGSTTGASSQSTAATATPDDSGTTGTTTTGSGTTGTTTTGSGTTATGSTSGTSSGTSGTAGTTSGATGTTSASACSAASTQSSGAQGAETPTTTPQGATPAGSGETTAKA
jgi:RNA polymerase sigma factor (sigma-70 family)